MLLTRVRARGRLRAIVLLCFGGTLSSLFLMAPPVWGQEGDALDVPMMRRALGMSGLRRSIALDTPLGALLMRNNTYRIAKLSAAAVPAGDRKFSSSSAIGQFNSVLDIGTQAIRPFFYRRLPGTLISRCLICLKPASSASIWVS